MSRTERLWTVLALNLGSVAGLVLVGVSAHSLAVLAEGADYLGDAAAIGVSLLAIWQTARQLRELPSPARSSSPRAGLNWLDPAAALVVSVVVA